MAAATDDPRQVVIDGYAKASHAYRGDEFPLAGSSYAHWVKRFTALVPAGARVLDLGCGNGLPVARALAERYAVTGVDLSPEQVDRARALVQGATFVCADMARVELPAASFAGVAAFWSLINLPVAEHAGMIARIAAWLAPGGHALAVVGRDAWTGIEEDWRGVPGARMYYSQASVHEYRAWFAGAGLAVVEEGREPREGNPGYAVMIARRPAAGA